MTELEQEIKDRVLGRMNWELKQGGSVSLNLIETYKVLSQIDLEKQKLELQKNKLNNK
jgi:hypothetical protein